MLVCYHHDDLDGKAAGYCVHKFKPNTIEDSPDFYFSCSYEDKFNKHTIRDDVFIVDLSISDATYQMLIDTCNTARSVTWIDHHATSVDIIKKHKDELQSIRNLTYFVSNCACGAALTYAYLHLPQNELMDIRNIGNNEEYDIVASYSANTRSISITTCRNNKNRKTESTWYNYGIPLPRWLYHIDDYDCWKGIDCNTNNFTLGCDSFNTSLTIYSKAAGRRVFNNFWGRLTQDVVIDRMIKDGEIIYSYLKSRYSRELVHTFEWNYDGTTFICKNADGNSWNFQSLIKKYPAAIMFNYSGRSGMWSYSIYSDEKSSFDCKAFAEKMGGGGHTHASGFSSKKLIFHNKDFVAKANEIFLGGTCDDDDWREAFIASWKNIGDPNIALYNPVVEDWTKEAKDKEDEVKANACINLFLITPNMHGYYSLVEATECSHFSKVFLAIYNDGRFDDRHMKSFKAIGDIIEKAGGVYKVYNSKNDNEMDNVVMDIMAALNNKA